MGNCMTYFQVEKRRSESPLHLLFFQASSAQNCQYAKGAYFGVAYSEPFNTDT